MGLSREEIFLKTINVVAHITGALSMFGSGWILTEVLLDRQKRKMSYHRIIFGMSFFDFFSSFGFAMSNWARSNEGFSYGAKGTVLTCDIVGFFIFLGSMTIPSYSASLTLYYKLMICDGWQERRIEKDFEYYVHRAIPSIGIVFSIPPLIMKLYNPYYFFCFVSYTKERGDWGSHGVILSYTFLSISLFTVLISAIIIAYSISSIIWKVRKTYRDSTSYEFENTFRKKCCCFISKRYVNNKILSRRESRLQQRGRKVVNMSLLYLIPFLITWVIPSFLIYTASVTFVMGVNFWDPYMHILQIYLATFLPLQGFFNWFVYMYRRYQMKMSRCASNTFSIFNFFKIVGEVLIRILNLRGTEDDQDCILGSGLEEVIFEENLQLGNSSTNDNEIELMCLRKDKQLSTSEESTREAKDGSSGSFIGCEEHKKDYLIPPKDEEEEYFASKNFETSLEERNTISFHDESKTENNLEKISISPSLTIDGGS